MQKVLASIAITTLVLCIIFVAIYLDFAKFNIYANLSTKIVEKNPHTNANAVTQVNEKTENTIPNLTYIKDNHGICYAVINNVTYNGTYPNIIKSITTVDCKKVDL